MYATKVVDRDTLILSELDAVALTSRCSTNAAVGHICNDRSFWLNKVATVRRRELQTDWFIRLAELGEERMLSLLLEAILRKRVVLDEWAVVVALMNLKTPESSPNGIRAVLYDILETGSVMASSYGSSERILEIRDTIDEEHERMVSDWKRSQTITVPDQGVYTYRSTANPHHLYLQRKQDKFLGSLPSPSFFLAELLSGRTVDGSALQEFLLQTLIPYLVRQGQIDVLIAYKHDLDATPIKQRKYLIGSDQPEDLFVVALTDAVIEHGTIDDAKRLFGSDWVTVLNDSYACSDAKMFRYLAKLVDYTPDTVVTGYFSMEPEEWLRWFETLPSTVQKNIIIGQTVDNATRDGWTYFSTKVRVYAKKKGYEL